MSVVEYIAYIQKHVNGQWIFMAYLWPAAEQWKQCCTYHSCCIIRRHVKKKLPTKLNFIMNSFLSSVIVVLMSNFKKILVDFKQYVRCIQFYPVWLPWYELYIYFLDHERSYQAYISFDCATNTTLNLNKLSSPVLRRILRTSNKIVGFFWVRSCSLVQIFMFPDTTSKTLPHHWLRNAQKMNKSILVAS